MTAELKYRQGSTPLGYLLIATEDDALVYAEFGETPDALLRQFRSEFPGHSSPDSGDPLLDKAWAAYRNYLHEPHALEQIPVRLSGTEFQLQVWNALQQLPTGSRKTYTALAQAIGQPTAVRAVASACARNSIALRIPCHRILRSDGALGGYRWGLAMKRRLLSFERQVDLANRAAALASQAATD